MATSRNGGSFKGNTRRSLERPVTKRIRGITEEYITQLSEEIEGRVTKKLSQEFIRTKFRIFGAQSKLDEFLLNPQERPGIMA